MLVARPRWPLLCALGALVLALHIVALFALGPGWLDPDPDPDRQPMPAPPMQVRSVMLPRPSAMLDPPAMATPPAPKPGLAAERNAPPPRVASGPPSVPAPVPAAVAVPVESGRDAAPEQAASAEPVAEPLKVPVYATRLPPSGRWRYHLQRGLVAGEAELQWALSSDGGYQVLLEGRIVGVPLLEWASQGEIDAAGVAPDRFAVRRRGRDRQAANFQRDAGKITFSGPTHELPLRAGAQDRLSWMIQLPAIVAAAPGRFVAGATVLLFVAGARGDGDVWTFVVEGVEKLGDTTALKLLREPRKPYDTRAEIWLDPAEHYLPLRVLQTPSGGGPALDLLREREAR